MAVPQGTFRLRRHPVRASESMRAWDAADELLLHRLAGHDVGIAPDGEGWTPIEVDGPTVILNDGYGALAVAVASSHPTVVADSYSSRRALENNLERNGLPVGSIRVISPMDPLPDHLDSAEPIGLLVFRPPRSLSLLEHQLRAVAPLLGGRSVIIGAEMTKHLHSGALEVMERVIGPTVTSRAHRRARLIMCQRDPSLDPDPWPWPVTFGVEPGAHRVTSMPGVFSADHLDQGTALLLQHLPETEGSEQIVDLGCGNGVIGLVAAAENADAELTFVDDSALAIASARLTFAEAFGDDRSARFVNGNSLLDWPGLGPVGDAVGEGPMSIEPGSVGLVLNNPPFHDDHAVGDAIAWQMFSDSARALRVGGEFWCVGNRHLAYHAKLKRLFGNCEVVASNAKFVVLRAVRR